MLLCVFFQPLSESLVCTKAWFLAATVKNTNTLYPVSSQQDLQGQVYFDL